MTNKPEPTAATLLPSLEDIEAMLARNMRERKLLLRIQKIVKEDHDAEEGADSQTDTSG